MADKISVDRIDKMIRIVFQELKTMGGEARPRQGHVNGPPRLRFKQPIAWLFLLHQEAEIFSLPLHSVARVVPKREQ